MPIIFRETIYSDTEIGVWKIDESLDTLYEQVILSESEKEVYATFVHDTRRKQWLAVRILLQQLTNLNVEIFYDENEKPYLNGNPIEISISHSKEKAAIIISKSRKVGIDIESFHPKIENLAHKFVSGKEFDAINPLTRKEQIHVIWGAKEAMYKLYGKKNIQFIENLLVEPFTFSESGKTIGFIDVAEDKSNIQLFFKKIAEYILVYAIAEK